MQLVSYIWSATYKAMYDANYICTHYCKQTSFLPLNLNPIFSLSFFIGFLGTLSLHIDYRYSKGTASLHIAHGYSKGTASLCIEYRFAKVLVLVYSLWI